MMFNLEVTFCSKTSCSVLHKDVAEQIISCLLAGSPETVSNGSATVRTYDTEQASDWWADCSETARKWAGAATYPDKKRGGWVLQEWAGTECWGNVLRKSGDLKITKSVKLQISQSNSCLWYNPRLRVLPLPLPPSIVAAFSSTYRCFCSRE